MELKALTLVAMILLPLMVIGQKAHWTNAYSIGIEIDVGHSFPNFDKEQTQWEGTFYPAGGLILWFTNKINRHWSIDFGAGLTAYVLSNKGPVDSYILDFVSPKAAAGVSYNFENRMGKEYFVKLTGGINLGYQGLLIDEFETYSVRIQGHRSLLPFVRPEIGLRRYFKTKIKRTKYKTAYEFGTFFRYNIYTLGRAQIRDNNLELTLEPRGNILGGYFKILFPVGRKRLKLHPQKERKLPPVIYNPRFL